MAFAGLGTPTVPLAVAKHASSRQVTLTRMVVASFCDLLALSVAVGAVRSAGGDVVGGGGGVEGGGGGGVEGGGGSGRGGGGEDKTGSDSRSRM